MTQLLLNAKEIQTLEKVLLNHKEIEYFGYYGSDVTTIITLAIKLKERKKKEAFIVY